MSDRELNPAWQWRGPGPSGHRPDVETVEWVPPTVAESARAVREALSRSSLCIWRQVLEKPHSRDNLFEVLQRVHNGSATSDYQKAFFLGKRAEAALERLYPPPIESQEEKVIDFHHSSVC